MNGAPPTDWRMRLSAERRRHLRAWLLSGALLTFLILVVGGITRLTNSGLSMVDWKPLMGVIPPIGDAEWHAAFARYQEFPEYRKLRPDMTLAQFQFIFFWEYTHRLLARLIGLVFLVPFAYFAVRGYFSGPLLRRVLALFGLGAMQGVVGWLMVSSGLVDNPRVSHYRLAAHLFMALSVFSLCLWLRHDLADRPAAAARPAERRGVQALGVLLLLQILWGAFVAGLDAGLFYNTFPLMGGRLAPAGGLSLEPALLNAVANPITVQWIHRVLGTVLLGAALAVLLRARRQGPAPWATWFAALVAVQYGLGIATLLFFVPVTLGVIHQAVAVVILAVWLGWLHAVRRAGSLAAAAPRPAAGPARRADPVGSL